MSVPPINQTFLNLLGSVATNQRVTPTNAPLTNQTVNAFKNSASKGIVSPYTLPPQSFSGIRLPTMDLNEGVNAPFLLDDDPLSNIEFDISVPRLLEERITEQLLKRSDLDRFKNYRVKVMVSNYMTDDQSHMLTGMDTFYRITQSSDDSLSVVEIDRAATKAFW